MLCSLYIINFSRSPRDIWLKSLYVVVCTLCLEELVHVAAVHAPYSQILLIQILVRTPALLIEILLCSSSYPWNIRCSVPKQATAPSIFFAFHNQANFLSLEAIHSERLKAVFK